MSSFKERHEKTAKLTERTVKIVIDPAAGEALAALAAKVTAMANQPATATLEGDPLKAVKQQYDDLKAKVAVDAVEFRIRALPRLKFTALKLEHPPREGIRVDELYDCNYDDVAEAIIRRGTVEPVMDEADWAWLIGDGTDGNPGVLSGGMYDKLAQTAWSANQRDIDVPLLLAASDPLPISSDE